MPPTDEVAIALGEIQAYCDKIGTCAAEIEAQLPMIKDDAESWRLALGWIHHAQRTVYDQERAMLRMAMALSRARPPTP